jgi:hypothetical protein
VGAAFLVGALIVALVGLKWMGSAGSEGVPRGPDGWALGATTVPGETQGDAIPASPAAVAIRVGATNPGAGPRTSTTTTTRPGQPGTTDSGLATGGEPGTTDTSGDPGTTQSTTSILGSTTSEDPTTSSTEDPTTTSTSDPPPSSDPPPPSSEGTGLLGFLLVPLFGR